MSTKPGIAALITQERERAGLNKSQLARAIGWTGPSYMMEIEKGEAAPTEEKLEEIIEVLAVSPRIAEQMRVANWEARTTPEGIKLAERRAQEGTQGEPGASIPEGTIPIVWIRVVDETFTGDPKEVVMGAKGPEVVGHAPISATLLEEHESCLGLLVSDDKMAPKIGHGAVVVASMTQRAVHGKLAVVGWEKGTICRIWRKRGKRVTLTPMNPEFPAMEMDKSKIKWAQLVIWIATPA